MCRHGLIKVRVNSASRSVHKMRAHAVAPTGTMDPRVRQLYRTLVWMGRDYPGGIGNYRTKLKRAFKRTPAATEKEMEAALAKGDYVIKELEALYFLSRYRHLKRAGH